jgi:hypothetical protein
MPEIIKGERSNLALRLLALLGLYLFLWRVVFIFLGDMYNTISINGLGVRNTIAVRKQDLAKALVVLLCGRPWWTSGKVLIDDGVPNVHRFELH